MIEIFKFDTNKDLESEVKAFYKNADKKANVLIELATNSTDIAEHLKTLTMLFQIENPNIICIDYNAKEGDFMAVNKHATYIVEVDNPINAYLKDGELKFEKFCTQIDNINTDRYKNIKLKLINCNDKYTLFDNAGTLEVIKNVLTKTFKVINITMDYNEYSVTYTIE